MINQVILVGRITKDIELRYTQSNIAVVKFTLAVNDKYNKDDTDFIQCVAWRKSAENMSKFVSKGSLLGIEGHIKTGAYDNKDGVRVYTTDVICDSVQFLDSKKSNDMEPQFNNDQKKYDNKDVDVFEEETPF